MKGASSGTLKLRGAGAGAGAWGPQRALQRSTPRTTQHGGASREHWGTHTRNGSLGSDVSVTLNVTLAPLLAISRGGGGAGSRDQAVPRFIRRYRWRTPRRVPARMRAFGRAPGAPMRLALLLLLAAGTSLSALGAPEALQRAPTRVAGAAHGGTVLVGLVDGSVHAIDAETGAFGRHVPRKGALTRAAPPQGRAAGASRRARR